LGRPQVCARIVVSLLVVSTSNSADDFPPTELALNSLKIEMNVNEEKYMEDWHRQRKSANLILRMEEYIQQRVVRTSIDHESSIPQSLSDDNVSQVSGMAPDNQFHHDAHTEIEASGRVENADENYGGTRRESLFDYGGNHR
jgi:hypothetical protein